MRPNKSVIDRLGKYWKVVCATTLAIIFWVGTNSSLTWTISGYPVTINSFGEYRERFFGPKDPTAANMIGVWFTRFGLDPHDSNRQYLMNALQNEVNNDPEIKKVVEIKSFQQTILGPEVHVKARVLGKNANAAIVISGITTNISDYNSTDIFLTLPAPYDDLHDLGPMPVGSSRPGRKANITPDAMTRECTRMIRLIMAYVESKRSHYADSARYFESVINDFDNSKADLVAFHHMAGIGRQFSWRQTKNKTDFEEAKSHLKFAALNCASLIPSAVCVNARVNLGVLYLKNLEKSESEKWLLSALKFSTSENAHFVHLDLAALYWSESKLNAAENAYKQAVAIKPTFIDGLLAYGNFLFRQNRYEEASNQFQEVIRLAPNEPSGYLDLGLCLKELGREAEGDKLIEKAKYLVPAKLIIGDNAEQQTNQIAPNLETPTRVSR